MKTHLNKFLFTGFFFLACYLALFTRNYLLAAAYLGTGLAFDPFNTQQRWGDRPLWQKAVLILALLFLLTLFGLGLR